MSVKNIETQNICGSDCRLSQLLRKTLLHLDINVSKNDFFTLLGLDSGKGVARLLAYSHFYGSQLGQGVVSSSKIMVWWWCYNLFCYV